MNKDFERCVMERDQECVFIPGSVNDLTIVRFRLRHSNWRIWKDHYFQPYFCGHEQECTVIGSKWALAQAKRNVEKFYPVVGTLEHLQEMFLVLENGLPDHFAGISRVYNNDLKGRSTIL